MNLKAKKVIFISDQFGYRCGGCNTVNYEMCLALQQTVKEDIEICSLVINCYDKQRVENLEKKAENLGIKIVHQNIINLEEISLNEREEICTRIFACFEERVESIWVGHDIFTGSIAIDLAKYTMGRSAVCIHTDYDTIEGLKGVNHEGLVKESRQRKIILGANIVFAIGPRLMERVQEVRKTDVYELIPGMSFLKENDIFNKRAVVTFGRFEGNVAKVKQVHLVLAAFGLAVSKMNDSRDYILHVIGTPEKEEQHLRAIAQGYAKRRLSINFLEYTQNREQLFDILKNNCVGLLVSISEGFGLAGWEIISAGVPLILTKKSGLYDYLVKKFGYLVNGMCLPVDLKGGTTEELCDEDVELVAEKIVTVFRNTKQLRKSAITLRMELGEHTWYKMVQEFAEHLGLSTNNLGKIDIYSDTYKERQDCIEEILNKLEKEEFGNNYVIFFGGISQKLCSERAIKKLQNWLEGNATRKLVLCYESGAAALQRAKELDIDKMPQDELPNNPKERMKCKEKLVSKSINKYSINVRNQISLVKLESMPMTYVIVVDGNLFVTLLLETRSSVAMTMKIKHSSIDEKKKVIESMRFTLEKQKEGKEEKKLLELLKIYENDYLI
ncbi:MAG: glycosyltransferase family 4 protein [Hungatella sp.]|nr:glycosyltransferase family 4 protein [Hungatella sp.]